MTAPDRRNVLSFDDQTDTLSRTELQRARYGGVLDLCPESYPTWQAYADAGTGRDDHTGEAHFGDNWMRGNNHWPHWLITWSPHTHEIVAHRQAPAGDDAVIVLGHFATAQAVADAIAGWRDVAGRFWSLEWAAFRLTHGQP